MAELLDHPPFFGQQVTLQGMTTQQLSPGSFLFSDGTGSMPVDFQAPPFPVLNSAVSLQGTVVPGTGDFAARINVTSFDEPAPFSCDDIIEVRARFSDPGFVAGDVVGLYLAYRGTPPGEKILEVDWDEHSGSPVDRFEVGEGTARDGLFDLEGVVGHEYNVSGTETKNVRANLFIEGRSGSCSRVRDVTVTKGSGPGFAAGGALRLEFDDPVLSGGFFSVTATVNNVAGATADAILQLQATACGSWRRARYPPPSRLYGRASSRPPTSFASGGPRPSSSVPARHRGASVESHRCRRPPAASASSTFRERSAEDDGGSTRSSA